MENTKSSAAKFTDSSSAVKYGVVYYKPSKISLQNTRKYWCELYRESSYHPRQLVLIESHKSTQEVSETIVLENVYKVLVNEGLIKGKSVFHIMTSKGKFTLATDSSKETDSWVNTLNEELFGPPKCDVIYKYRVQVKNYYKEDVPHGDYLLKVYNKEIRLFTPDGLIPTKFRCSIEEIHRVKCHSVGPQEFHVIISIKNALTNNKPKDILLLSARSASDVVKVINFRKKHLAMQDDCTVVCHDPEFKDRQKEPLKARNSHSLDGAASYPQEKSKPHTNEKIQTTTSNCNSGREIKLTKSLPHMYNMTSSPSIDEDGDAWSESFDLRAPKRQLVVKIKDQPRKCCPSISSRPPAVLPHAAKINLDESFGDESSATYDYVRKAAFLGFAKLKINSAAVTKTAELQGDNSNEEGYVINSINYEQIQEQYLHAAEPQSDESDEEAYVINSIDYEQIQEQYLHGGTYVSTSLASDVYQTAKPSSYCCYRDLLVVVLSSTEDCLFTFMPDRSTK